GKPREGDGLFFEPTVLVDVNHDMTCMTEETFGPTLPIMKVRDADEAVALANDSVHGPSSSVFTESRAKGEGVASPIQTGGRNIDEWLRTVFTAAVPMGGGGAPGIGARLGPEGIQKYCRRKAIVRDRLGQKTELHWYPADEKSAKTMSKATRFLGARDWRR